MSQTAKPKTRALGRGLSALIPDAAPVPVAPNPERPDPEGVRRVPVEEVRPMPGQPRSRFAPNDLNDLAASITENGILQPLLVRSAPDGYELIAGERRWRAAQLAGLATVPVILKEVETAVAFQLALVENLQRENLNPVDVGRAFQRMMDDYQLTQEDVAERVGKDRSSVANHLRILKLPRHFVAAVEDGKLSFGHARCLAGLSGPQLAQLDDAKLVAGHMSVRELERRAAALKAGRERKGQSASSQSAQVRYLQRQLEQHLGLKVRLKDRNGRGQLAIDYANLDELDGLLRLLGIGN